MMPLLSQRTSLPHHSTSQAVKIVIFLGVTGSGKSSFIKAVTSHSDVVVGHGLCSSTETVRSYHTTIGSNKFMLVDTPGFNDTFRDDREILKEITDWLASTYQEGKRITGIIYLHPINQPRMEGSAILNLAVMQQLCGSETFENVTLASTFWDVVDEVSGVQRENELCQTPKFWGGMKRNGSKVVRIRDYVQSKEILIQLAQKPEVTLHIQTEMVDEKKKLSATAAAQKLDQESLRLQEEHQRQMKLIEDRTKADLKNREEENKRKLAKQLARQKSADRIKRQLAEDKQRTEQLLQQEKIKEQNRLAREAKLQVERERQKLKAIQEQKEKLAREQRQMEAALKEMEAKERKRRDVIAKNVRAAGYRSELRTQRQAFFEALSKWTVRAYTFTFEQQTPDFINWCDRCFDLIRFGGFHQCHTCMLQICAACWDKGDRCGDDGQQHRIASSSPRIQPSNCCSRLRQSAGTLLCDRFGCGEIIRGLHFHCCHCTYGEFDVCLKCIISGWTCPGDHKLHPSVNWPNCATR